ncbi:MAG: TetR/AcrR family transcriptional regulator [Caldimicrobium sp.]|nr:TetR/AcrR family transcriptional regulator [Caldimicrobium sp.]MCX7873531.1 TetR/AcrR family transcriptional regulator [Caldimicrobium sp.]MDW8094690.1 TetR/AcrR family transcriptional regulator [Caldimicrobium sp.]
MGKGTKERILFSALKLFSEKGYLGATTREIAKEAGISEVTLFRHFVTKENLFISLLNKHSFLPILKELIKDYQSKPLKESLVAIATAFIKQLRENKALVKIMHAEFNRYPEPIKKVYKNLIEDTISELARYFQNFQKRGEIISIDPYILAQAFLGLFYSYFQCEEIGESERNVKFSEDFIISTYVEIFLKGLLIP